MSNLILATNYVADVAIPKYRIVKHGTGDRAVTAATAATDSSIGVTNELDTAAGERVDVWHVGIAYVEAGAAVTRGAPVTADAQGRGVTAAPAAGSNARVVGFALEAATAAGDVIRVLLSPCVMQG